MNSHDKSGPAFPSNELSGSGEFYYSNLGMTFRDYAAIEFAKAWTSTLAARCFAANHLVSDEDIAVEANRLGIVQANHLLRQRDLVNGEGP